MRLNRFIKEDQVDLDFDPDRRPLDPWASSEDVKPTSAEDEEPTRKQLLEGKERALRAMVALLEKSGRITNPSKCLTDLLLRERKATTGLGNGLAIPHVRTPQAKQFVMAVARVPAPGLWFDAVDEEPVRLIVCMVAPAHDDKFYLKVERALAAAFVAGDELKEQLLAADDPGDVIRILGDLID